MLDRDTLGQGLQHFELVSHIDHRNSKVAHVYFGFVITGMGRIEYITLIYLTF